MSEELETSGPEIRKLSKMLLLICCIVIGSVRGTGEPTYGEMKMIEELIAIVMAVLALTLMANRKPRFEVPSERQSGSAINWFTLKKDSTAEIKIKQLYFGIGVDFEQAGWMIPPHKSDHMLCLIVAESEVEVETSNKGLQTWFVTLVTQSVAGDLYREALKAQQSKVMKWCPAKEMMDSPNLDFDMTQFDVLALNGSHHVSVRINHEQHPTNPTKSFYKLDWN